jgi:chemotaxis protein methyltransferase CheR
MADAAVPAVMGVGQAMPLGAEPAVLEALRGLVGFEPSEVLRARLRRAAPLVEAAAQAAPDLDHPAWAALLDAATVPETRFFRGAPQLEAFRTGALPALARRAVEEGRPLRLLSAGCSTGEEAYTLAMLGAEAMMALPEPRFDVEVVGLDISRPCLEAARIARYRMGPPDPLRDVPKRLRHFVTAWAGALKPAFELRAVTGFARRNLLTLDDVGAWDAIACRNVLIYLTEPARREVTRRLAAALRPGGALLLGATDQAGRDLPLRPRSDERWQVLRREPNGKPDGG